MNNTEILNLFNRYARTMDDLAAARAERMAAFGGDIRKFDAASDKYRELTLTAERIANEIRTALTEKADDTELKHPGTWLPGDQFVDLDGDTWTRGEQGWSFLESQTGATVKSGARDEAIDRVYFEADKARIVHLAPRENVEAVR